MTVKFKDSSTTEKMLANRKMIRFSGVLVGTLVLIFTGCQTDKLVVNDQSFMTLWSAYDHCQSSADLDAMRVDVKRLEEGSQTAQDNTLSVKHDQAQPFPHLSERWIASSISRLSVDPKAMAAACTLYTGQTAAQSGRTDLAGELFASVVASYPQPPYAYYVDQARRGLSHLTFQNALLTTGPVPHMNRVSTQ